MPVKSYLICTQPGRRRQLEAQLRRLPGCTVWPAQNREALVVVTDTASEAADDQLRGSLEALDSLASLTLVAAFAAPDDLVAIGRGVRHETA